MARRRRKKEALMGRLIVTTGIAFKVIQVIGAAFSVSALAGPVMTVITSCLLVGGLAVIAAEKMNITSAFALISLIGIVGGLLPSDGAVFSFIFMAVSFAAYGAMLLSMKRPWRVLAAVIIFISTVVLALCVFDVVSLHFAIITLCLLVNYGFMALGLYI